MEGEGCDCHCADRAKPRHFLQPANDIAFPRFSSNKTVDLTDFDVQLLNLAQVKSAHALQLTEKS